MKKSFWERRQFFEVYSPVPGRTSYTSGHHLFSFRQSAELTLVSGQRRKESGMALLVLVIRTLKLE
jgi:hypothetical protein